MEKIHIFFSFYEGKEPGMDMEEEIHLKIQCKTTIENFESFLLETHLLSHCLDFKSVTFRVFVFYRGGMVSENAHIISEQEELQVNQTTYVQPKKKRKLDHQKTEISVPERKKIKSQCNIFLFDSISDLLKYNSFQLLLYIHYNLFRKFMSLRGNKVI